MPPVPSREKGLNRRNRLPHSRMRTLLFRQVGLLCMREKPDWNHDHQDCRRWPDFQVRQGISPR